MLANPQNFHEDTYLTCSVKLLEPVTVLECKIGEQDTGDDLLEYICDRLSISDYKLFGLKYVDENKHRQWLDVEELVFEQMENLRPIRLSFRLRFYPPQPHLIRSSITRYYIFLQLQLDLRQGKLFCDLKRTSMLIALILQHIYGDYDSNIHGDNYIHRRFVPKQNIDIRKKAMKIHRKALAGQSQPEVEELFLKIAWQLTSYGADPQVIKYGEGKQFFLGSNYSGVLVFLNERKIKYWAWLDIKTLGYESNEFIIEFVKKGAVILTCLSEISCSYIWNRSVSQLKFFAEVWPVIVEEPLQKTLPNPRNSIALRQAQNNQRLLVRSLLSLESTTNNYVWVSSSASLCSSEKKRQKTNISKSKQLRINATENRYFNCDVRRILKNSVIIYVALFFIMTSISLMKADIFEAKNTNVPITYSPSSYDNMSRENCLINK